jgi:hypothetical protein
MSDLAWRETQTASGFNASRLKAWMTPGFGGIGDISHPHDTYRLRKAKRKVSFDT